MPETLRAHIYDFPVYYDLVYGSDWKAEFEFLQAAFARYAQKPVRKLFEPACGTGRLLIRFAKAGYEVAGVDLNPKAVDFCNRRLARHGFPASARVADMSDFRTRKKYDAAFNMINSFRHLPTETAAENHLRCVANCLTRGGLYFLGLHLTPTKGERVSEEHWPARRGNLAVLSSLWSEGIDLRRRNELVGMSFDVYTPSRVFRIEDQMDYRTYTARQMQKLLDTVDVFDVVETFDFRYEIDRPQLIDATTEDVVFVLRRR